jgi:DNA polymerase III delta subunit
VIYLIHGSDFEKARAKMRELRDALAAKKPDATQVRIDSESFSLARLAELAASAGLFEDRSIVTVDRVCVDKDAKAALVGLLDDLKASPNIFILLEGELDKTTLAKIEKRAEKIQEFSEAKPTAKSGKSGKGENNFFALADALGRRDRKELWVLYRKAINAGAVPEELHGILFWQVKSTILAKESASAAEAGLNPFVYKKASAFAGSFTAEELTVLSSNLVSMYHDAHRGIVDFETALELFVVEL